MFDPEEIKQLKDLFNQSEERLGKKIDLSGKELEKRLIKKIEEAKNELRLEIGDYISEILMPIIDEKADKKEVEKIKRHVGMVS